MTDDQLGERDRVLRLIDQILDAEFKYNIDLCIGEEWVKKLREAVAEGKEEVEGLDD